MNQYWGLVKALIVLGVSDALYLSTYGDNFVKMITKIQGSQMKVRLPPALLVYVFIFGAWGYFIYNVRHRYSVKENVLRGFILGLTTYGIYDFTNMAIIKGWELRNALVDTLWGGILYAFVTFVAVV